MKIEILANALNVEPYKLIKPDHLNDAVELPDKIDKKIGRNRRKKLQTK